MRKTGQTVLLKGNFIVNFERTTPLLTQKSDSEILNIDFFLQNRLLCPLLRWRLNIG